MLQTTATVERILDSAEVLFAEHGFAETSLRSITSKAGVNLAAVNYHFGSKKSLIHAVFSRFLDPFIENMAQRIDSIERQNRSMILEEVLMLLVDEILAIEPRRPDDLPRFMRLMGLAYSQHQGHLKKYLTESYGVVFEKYFHLLRGTCPELPAADMFWRTNFILGSAIFSMSSSPALLAIAERDYGIEEDLPGILKRMIPFMAAGLKASNE